MSAGSGHSLVVLDDGELWAWGRNQAGQIGRDTGGSHVLSPEQPHGLATVPGADAGGAFSVALLDNGAALAWGGTMSTPAPVAGFAHFAGGP